MPELPEVESARSVIERAALGRRITDVDDSDTYVCRPYLPGHIRSALIGRRLETANRRGKYMWCSTTDGPELGIHLGMSGKIVVADGAGVEIDGGDYWERGRKPGDFRYTRFSLTFEDGGRMVLVDPRRLGRIGLDWPVERLGPDAATITPAQFRKAVERGTAPIKARLLDQQFIAGIGNLLADEILWLSRINPSRRVADLSDADVAALLRGLRRAVKSAIRDGGVHTLSIVAYRKADALCPRDKAPMARSTVGGRTSWWCSREQAPDA